MTLVDRIFAWLFTALVVVFVGFVLLRDWSATTWNERGGIAIAGVVGVNFVWALAKDNAEREAHRCPHCGRLP